MKKIAITTGDPNGIGFEITQKALKKLNLPKEFFLIITTQKLIDFYGGFDKNYEIIEVPLTGTVTPGKITKESGEFSFNSVKLACELAHQNKISAIVTAPTAKNTMHLAGHNFNGQTEILQNYLAHDNQLAEMLFVAENFRVLLLTRHIPLKEICLSKELVIEKVVNLNIFFQNALKIKNPKFALCGFNPHAGENGILGNEELEILIPAVEELKTKGINITQPLPSDTLFVKAGQEYLTSPQAPPSFDCYIANYHDQGLIPIKTIAGSKTVNMTIGLDIIRTSPGHGTAFDIAGKGIANSESMEEAIKAVL